MRLLFKQRLFSWFDSYDIYDENGNTAYTVRGRLSWGHKLEIYNGMGNYVGKIQEEIFTFMPRFAMYIGNNYIGRIRKEFTWLKPRFSLDCNGWSVQGDYFQWDYNVINQSGLVVMHASKQLWNLTDTYTIDIANSQDSLISLMIVLAIDAAKCSRSD